jgi:hypothetical protein
MHVPLDLRALGMRTVLGLGRVALLKPPCTRLSERMQSCTIAEELLDGIKRARALTSLLVRCQVKVQAHCAVHRLAGRWLDASAIISSS